MSNFTWTEFYSEFATSLLKYADNRASLIENIKQIYINAEIKLPTLERENNIVDIDPFVRAFYAILNHLDEKSPRKTYLQIQVNPGQKKMNVC